MHTARSRVGLGWSGPNSQVDLMLEMTQVVLSMLRSHSRTIPGEGLGISCGELNHTYSGSSPIPDTIDLLTEPTLCRLIDRGCEMELAYGNVRPQIRFAIWSRYKMDMQWCKSLMCDPMRGILSCLS